jgi:serine/threonine protein kinase
MDAVTSRHPTPEALKSYSLGKLDDDAAGSVSRHLDSCADCQRRVAEMSSDSFLAKLQGAEARPDRAVGGLSQLAVSTAGVDPAVGGPPRAETLPLGLVDHPDYEIKRELGRGGMGVVYLAHNKLMGRDEVLKVMGRHLMDRPGVLERFLREIRSVARLRHPNIVTAFHATRLGESIVFAMEHVDGLDLSRMVKAKGPLPVAHACNFAYQAALGLQHAHEEGVVHRDIKPGNLMLARSVDKATIKILDFGLAKATREEKIDGSLTREGQALGTPDFIAPEQILDATTAGIRADIYSLGATLYYLLTGRPPFQASSLYDMFQAHISRDADPLNLVRPEVPAELAALVAKMMAKDPARRFQTPGEVAQALTPFFKSRGASSVDVRPEVSHAGAAVAPQQRGTPGVKPSHPSATTPEPAPQAAMQREQPWESLTKLRETEPGSAPLLKPAGRPGAVQPDAQTGRSSSAAIQGVVARVPGKWRTVAAILALCSCIGIAASVVKLRTEDAVIVVENVPDDAVVEIDGRRISITPPEGAPIQIEKPAGKYFVEVRRGADKLIGESVTLESGKKLRLMVRLDRSATAKPPGDATAAGPTVSKLDQSAPATPGGIGPARDDKGSSPTGAKAGPELPMAKTELLSGSGDWLLEGNELVFRGTEGTILLGDEELSSYDLKFEGQIVAGKEGFVALFHRTTGDSFRFFHVGELNGQRVDLGSLDSGKERGLPSQTPTVKGRWYKIGIKVRGAECWCYLDGRELFHNVDKRFTKGRVGLATWDASARYRDIVISTPEGAVLWSGLPDLPGDKSQPGITPASLHSPPRRIHPAGPARVVRGASWAVAGDTLVKERQDTGWVSFGEEGWTDYDLSFEVRKNAGPGGVGVNFRINPLGELKCYVLILGLGDHHTIRLWSRSSDREFRSKPGTIQPGEWHRVKISMRGPRTRIELDDHALFAFTSDFSASGYVALKCYECAGQFRNVKVTAPDGTRLWEGPPDLLSSARKQAKPETAPGAAARPSAPAGESREFGKIVAANILRSGDLVEKEVCTVDQNEKLMMSVHGLFVEAL